MNTKTVDIFYSIGKVLLLVIIAALMFVRTDLGRWFLLKRSDCFFESVTGLYCPGCGATRAAVALLDGNVLRSFMYHPAILYFCVCFSVFMVKCFLHRHFNIGNVAEKRLMLAIYTGIGITIVQWLIKLTLLIGFKIRYL